MRELHLDNLKAGQPGISPDVAKFLVEAAILCLMENGHQSGVVLNIEGDYEEQIRLKWSGRIDDQTRRSWKDTNEAAEYGAVAIAALLIDDLEKMVVYERIPPSGEADYYLQSETKKIEALLEVLGIWKETKGNTPSIRVNVKKNRLNKPASKPSLPVYIIVTEFGEPHSKIEKYE